MVKITATVEGMMCRNCENHVSEAVKKAFGAKEVTSDHEKNTTEIIAKEPVDEAKLREVIEEAGYRMTGMKCEPYEKKGFSLFGKE